MSAITALIADDKSLITYRPELNKITGSVTATILLQQILYWYKNNDYKSFYKFKDKCTHELYKVGDSWVEELGFTKREFDTALKKLEEKKYVSHKTNMKRLTYYKIDIEKLSEDLENLYSSSKQQKRIYVNAESAFRKTTKAHLDYNDTETTTENNINAESDDSAKEKSSNKKNSYSTNFEILWNRYDKKSSNKNRSQSIYKKRWKNTDIKIMLEAIDKYKQSIDLTYQKDFDGFLNGVIDSYIPKRAWIKDLEGNKHTGYFYDNENKFISDDQRKLTINSCDVEEYISNKRFGYVA